jgi:hypothetical protein
VVSIVSRTEYIRTTHRFLFPVPVSIVTLKQARTSVACREEEEEGAQPSESAEFMRGEWEKTSKWVEDEKKVVRPDICAPYSRQKSRFRSGSSPARTRHNWGGPAGRQDKIPRICIFGTQTD